MGFGIRRARLGTCLGSLLPLAAGTALAAPPNAGTLMEEVKPEPPQPSSGTGALPQEASRPALPYDDTVRLTVSEIRITGATAIPEARLRALVAEAVGQELTLSGLQVYVERITRCYREAGYFLARAYLPAQEIKGGAVEIAVLEGRLGRLDVDNRSKLSEPIIKAHLADVQAGQVLASEALERDLLLLDDLPGVEVRSTLKPGASVGTTDLDVHLARRSPFAGSLSLDDYGNRYTGAWRLGGHFSFGDLTGLADVLDLHALHTDGLDYGRLAWQIPIGGRGTQVGAAWSEMHYRLGKDFANLEAHGIASIGSLYALHPFLRSRSGNLNGQLSYDHKRLSDDIDTTTTRTRKTLDNGTLGLSGDWLDNALGGGSTQWSLAYLSGRLSLDPESLALDRTGHRTQGWFGKWDLAAARAQYLADNWTLFGRLQAQLANTNLDSAEKMDLGGSQAVRAYPEGEAPCDDAWLASLELRYRFWAGWQASLFYDRAQGDSNHHPIAADGSNDRHLAGYGLGINYDRVGFSFQVALAWSKGPAPTSDPETRSSPRIWFRAVKRL